MADTDKPEAAAAPEAAEQAQSQAQPFLGHRKSKSQCAAYESQDGKRQTEVRHAEKENGDTME